MYIYSKETFTSQRTYTIEAAKSRSQRRRRRQSRLVRWPTNTYIASGSIYVLMYESVSTQTWHMACKVRGGYSVCVCIDRRKDLKCDSQKLWCTCLKVVCDVIVLSTEFFVHERRCPTEAYISIHHRRRRYWSHCLLGTYQRNWIEVKCEIWNERMYRV